MSKKILLIGASGTLGTALKDAYKFAHFPSHSELGIINEAVVNSYFKSHQFSEVVLSAAFISPPKVDADPSIAIQTNIIGTANIVSACIKYDKKIIYISTDYVFDGKKGNYSEEDPVFPINKYAWSKLGGECSVRLTDNHLIIRTSFGPDIFPYSQAYKDQWTSREQASLVAKKIISLIRRDTRGTVHVGGLRKSVYEYARSIPHPTILTPITRKDVSFVTPKDTSLNTSKFLKIIHKK